MERSWMDSFEDALLGVYNLSNSVAVSDHPIECAGASETALREAEAMLGQPLPSPVRAFYKRLDGGLWLHPAKVLRLEQLVQTSRVVSATMFDLRQALATPSPKDASEVLDPRVQAVSWHRDWWTIVEYAGGFLCVDMAPGPQGSVGQIIRVADPRHAHVTAAPQWVAASWLEVLAQLHMVWQGQSVGVLEALGPSRGHQLPPTWFMAEPVGPLEEILELWAPAAGRADEASSLWPEAQVAGSVAALRQFEQAWLQQQKPLDVQRVLRTRPLWLIHTLRDSPTHSTGWLTDPRQEGQLATQLQDWLRGKGASRLLLLEGNGPCGKKSMLEALRCWAAESEVGLPALLYVDLAAHAGAGTYENLSALVQVELVRRNLSIDSRALLQAVQQGHCALIFDRAEALLATQPLMWRWLQALHESADQPSHCRMLVCLPLATMSDQRDLWMAWARLNERPLLGAPQGASLAVLCRTQDTEAKSLEQAESPSTLTRLAPASAEAAHWQAALSWTNWLEQQRPPEWSSRIWAEVASATFDYFDALTACYWREESDSVDEALMTACRPAVFDAWSQALKWRCAQWWRELEHAQLEGTELLDGPFVQAWPMIRLLQLHCANDHAGFAARWAQWRELGAEDMIQQRWESLMLQLPEAARVPGATPP